MIKVYQIALNDAEIDAINRGEQTEKTKAYFERSWPMSTFKAENFQHYTHVATVDTRCMEQAFKSMNLWEDTKVTKMVRAVSSMSVGDILEYNGKYFRCASFGFQPLEDYREFTETEKSCGFTGVFAA
jgi:hypothetical protein